MKKTRISKKQLMTFISSIADVKPSTISDDEDNMVYYSKIDGSYLTRVGMEESLKHFLKKGITENFQTIGDGNTCCIAFNPIEQKWYGWSHRAIYGFGVGSECKKGHCGYKPSTPQELFDSITKTDEDGWQWQKPENVELTDNGVKVKVEMSKLIGSNGSEGKTSSFISESCDEILTPDCSENFVSIPCEPEYFDLKCGRGEWIAKTLDEAKLMASDFADGVS